MVRRALAAMVVLVTVLFVHTATPQAASIPAPSVAAAKLQVDERPPFEGDTMDAQAPPAHPHGNRCAPITLPRRAQNSAFPAPDGGNRQSAAVCAGTGGSAASLLTTVWDRRNPSGRTAPTPSMLQTFRC